MSDIDRRRHQFPDDKLVAFCTYSHESVVRELVTMLRESKRVHFWVDEDNWYSCPKAPDGCSNEDRGTECLCGADEWNAKIDELLAHYKEIDP